MYIVTPCIHISCGVLITIAVIHNTLLVLGNNRAYASPEKRSIISKQIIFTGDSYVA